MFHNLKRSKRWLAVVALGATIGAASAVVAATPAPAVSPQVGPYCFTSGPVTGSGATFQNNAQTVIRANYATRCNQLMRTPGTTTYNSVGSSLGRSQFCAETTQYGASDEPFTTTAKNSCETTAGGELNHFPVALGAITVSYNAPNVLGCTVPSPLILSGPQVSGIFAGAITNWSAIVNGCNAPLHRVVRADGSGTTFAFKDYMDKADPGVGWMTYANTAWPTGGNTPITGIGNPGVADGVNNNDGAFGYVELSVANNKGLTWAHVGNFTDDTLGLGTGQNPEAPDGSANCATSATGAVLPQSNESWEDVSITYGPTGYPICTFTYMLVWTDGTGTTGMSQGQEQTVADLVHIANDPKTQADLAAIGYGQLPPNARAVNHAGMLRLH